MAEMSFNDRADMVFKSLCNALNNNNVNYKYNEEQRVVDFTLQGEDLMIEIYIRINADNQVLSLYSHLPFSMPEDKRVEGAIAACVYSYNLIDGSFDYNMDNGNIDFRMAQSFLNRTIGEDLFMYMISLSINIVEQYNDKFFILSKGMLSIDDIVNQKS